MPYVVCDAVPVTGVQPEKYTLIMDGGAPFDVDPQTLVDGSRRLHYDVSGVPAGTHSMSVAAKNMWGASSTVPFGFTRSVPTVPTVIVLEV